jgi:hypothetical protein
MLGEGALSEIAAVLDGFKDTLADPGGDSPCTIFDFIASGSGFLGAIELW